MSIKACSRVIARFTTSSMVTAELVGCAGVCGGAGSTVAGCATAPIAIARKPIITYFEMLINQSSLVMAGNSDWETIQLYIHFAGSRRLGLHLEHHEPVGVHTSMPKLLHLWPTLRNNSSS